MKGYVGGLQSGVVTTIVLVLFLIFGVTMVKKEKKSDTRATLDPASKGADISKKEEEEDPCRMKTNRPSIEADHVKDRNQQESADTAKGIQDATRSKRSPEFQPREDNNDTDTKLLNDAAKIIASEERSKGMAKEGNAKKPCSVVTRGFHFPKSDNREEDSLR